MAIAGKGGGGSLGGGELQRPFFMRVHSLARWFQVFGPPGGRNQS